MDTYSAYISVYTIMPGANRGQKKTLALWCCEPPCGCWE